MNIFVVIFSLFFVACATTTTVQPRQVKMEEPKNLLTSLGVISQGAQVDGAFVLCDEYGNWAYDEEATISFVDNNVTLKLLEKRVQKKERSKIGVRMIGNRYERRRGLSWYCVKLKLGEIILE